MADKDILDIETDLMEEPEVSADMADSHPVDQEPDNLVDILEAEVDNLAEVDSFEVVQAVGWVHYQEIGMIEHWVVVVLDNQVVAQEQSVVQQQQHQEQIGQVEEGTSVQRPMVPIESSEKKHKYSEADFHNQCTLMVDLIQDHNYCLNSLVVVHIQQVDSQAGNSVAGKKRYFVDNYHPVGCHKDHLVGTVDLQVGWHNWGLGSLNQALVADDHILDQDKVGLVVDCKRHLQLLGLNQQQHCFVQLQNFDSLVVLDTEETVCTVEMVDLQFKNDQTFYNNNIMLMFYQQTTHKTSYSYNKAMVIIITIIIYIVKIYQYNFLSLYCPPNAFTNIKEFYLNSKLNIILEEDKKCKAVIL